MQNILASSLLPASTPGNSHLPVAPAPRDLVTVGTCTHVHIVYVQDNLSTIIHSGMLKRGSQQMNLKLLFLILLVRAFMEKISLEFI